MDAVLAEKIEKLIPFTPTYIFPKERLTQEQLKFLWDTVYSFWCSEKKHCDLAEFLLSPAFQQKFQSGSCGS